MNARHIIFFITAIGLFVIGYSEITKENQIQRMLLEKRIGPESLFEIEALSKFYEGSQEAKFTLPQAGQMIQAIEKAKTRGLNPDNYHWNTLQLHHRHSIKTNAVTQEEDLFLADAFLRLARHLAIGKMKPPSSWKLGSFAVNTVELLNQALTSNNISALLYSVEPKNVQYQILIEELRDYRQIAAKGGWEQVADGTKLFIGSTGDRVGTLRRRLKVTGEFYGESKEELIFDDLLDQAVRRFQQTHGLNVDGVVGRSTITELNVSVEKRIEQIVANLERMRWIPDDSGERHIQINIPAFELTAFVKNSEWLTMRIIVGKRDWQSPVFLTSEITYLETNPYWYVPAEIARKEIWPKVAKNQNYLKKNRLNVIKRSDGSLMLRQNPGPGNSLGRIKIHFANDFGCYLHDTPEKELFEKIERSFSHGCIRLENALELSEFLMIGDPEWDRQKLENTIENNLQKTIYLSQAVPISIVYFTVWVDSSNIVQFRKDIYGLDKITAQQLQRN